VVGKQVAEDLKTDPLSPGELVGLDAESLVAYGATLLVAAVTERFVLYLQLGDGEILAVSDSGEVVRPLTKAERFLEMRRLPFARLKLGGIFA
jgi:hypothetical protein